MLPLPSIPIYSHVYYIYHKLMTSTKLGPPLVRAATGEELTAEELGGAKVHCSISGCTDYHTYSEEEAMKVMRNVIASLNLSPAQRKCIPEEPPLYGDTSEEFSKLIPTSPDAEWPIVHVSSDYMYCKYDINLFPRPLPVFQCASLKNWEWSAR